MKNKTKISLIIIFSLVGCIVLWVGVALLVGFTGGFSGLVAMLHGVRDYRVWVLFACGIATVIVIIAIRRMRSSRRVLKINDIEDARWLTHDDVKNSDNLQLVSYSKLDTVVDGVPVYCKKQNNDLTVMLAKPIHTLIIGTTGSGKTTTFVDPTVQILCRTKTKPCLVLTDPKGELYRNHAGTLKKQDYSVITFDLSDPYSSATWNPFCSVIEKTKKAIEYKKSALTPDVVQSQGKYIDSNGVVHPTYESAYKESTKNGKYAFDGESYATIDEAKNARAVAVQTLHDEIFSDMQDLIYTLCPISSNNEPIWEEGARNFILGIAVALQDDFERGRLPENAFNLHTLYKTITDYATAENVGTVANYLCNGRSEFFSGVSLANTVLTAQDKQLTSYLAIVQNYMSKLSDSGIRRLTSESKLDFSTFDERPSALFIKIPDEKDNRHFIVTLLITQLYKTLVGKARLNYKNGETSDEQLKRNCYIVMDEFGNMPKFNNIDKIITVGRSRHIFMLPIIQDYAQLDNKYGKNIASIVRSNCNIKIFIGSTDKNTINEFSELCGKVKRQRTSFSGATDDKLNVSTSAESVPLVYPSELEKLNDPPKVMGNSVVLVYGKNPLKAKMEAVFACKKLYAPTPTVDEDKPQPQPFDEKEHYFNINKVVMENEKAMLEERERALRAMLAKAQTQRTENETLDRADDRDNDDEDEKLFTIVTRLQKRVSVDLASEIGQAFLQRHDDDNNRLIVVLDRVINASKSKRKNVLAADAIKLKNIILAKRANTKE